MKNLISSILKKLNNPNVKDKVTEELYQFIPKTLISTLILSLIFTGIFWFKVENQLILLSWLSAILAITLIRYVDYKHYQ
ncbi:MAG TPA: hypothetical protein ENK82_06820, partial [Campylobacterales bacterium]|nr:hypothetical protein [Campylobacterales bacterium]